MKQLYSLYLPSGLSVNFARPPVSQLCHYEAIARDFSVLIQTHKGHYRAIHRLAPARKAGEWVLEHLPKVGCCYVEKWDKTLNNPLTFAQLFLSSKFHPQGNPTIFEFLFEQVELPEGLPSLLDSTGDSFLDLFSGLIVSGNFASAGYMWEKFSLQDTQRIVARYNQSLKPREQLEKEKIMETEEFKQIKQLLELDYVRTKQRFIADQKEKGIDVGEI